VKTTEQTALYGSLFRKFLPFASQYPKLSGYCYLASRYFRKRRSSYELYQISINKFDPHHGAPVQTKPLCKYHHELATPKMTETRLSYISKTISKPVVCFCHAIFRPLRGVNHLGRAPWQQAALFKAANQPVHAAFEKQSTTVDQKMRKLYEMHANNLHLNHT